MDVAATSQPSPTVRVAGLRSAFLPRSWRTGLGAALGFWALLEGLMLWFAYGASAIGRVVADPQALWAPWYRWDALDRYAISQDGYASCQAVSHCGVFQPLQPGLGTVLREAGLGTGPALMLVSALGLGLALTGLYRLACRDHDAASARWTVAFMLAFPAALFLVAPYAKSLLLACSVWAFLAVRARRPGWAGLLVGAAILTKVGMVALLPALATELVLVQPGLRARVRGILELATPAAAALAGLLVFYQQVEGSPLSFLAAQRIYGRSLAPPWVALGDAVRHLPPLNLTGVPEVLDVGMTLVLIGAVVLAVRRLRPSYAVLLGSLALLFTCTTQLTSNARYTLAAFPLFIAAAVALRDRRTLRLVLLVAGGCLEVLLLWFYSQGYWAG